MRAPFLAGALVLAAWLPSSLGAAPAKAPQPHTLLTTPTRILKFAGDGDWIAWTAHDKRCALRLRLYSFRTHKRIDIHGRGDGISCGDYGTLALAGSHALWTSLKGAGNTELDVAVATASAAAPTARRVRQMAMIRSEYGAEPLSPPAAGRGATLAYYRHEDGIGGSPAYAVERVAGSRPARVFRFQDPIALAVDGGRVAAVRRKLERGDACNCNFDPAWSPDGTKLAYISGDPCCVDDTEHNDIYVQDSDRNRTRITTDARPKFGVAWSPDGTKLAFGSYDSNFALKLGIVNADGTGRHDISAGENPSWSPDGTRLAFDDRAHLYVVDADGSHLRQLTDGVAPAWSPNGTTIAYSASDALFSIAPDGSDKAQLAKGVSEPTWSPDGTMIAGSSYTGIKLVRADGTSPTLVRNTQRGDGNPNWTPDGRRIAFDSLRNDLVADAYARPELYVTDAAGGNLHPLTFVVYDEWWSALQVRSHYGRLLFGAEAFGEPLAVALDRRYEVVLSRPAHATARRLQIFRGPGSLLRQIAVPSSTNLLAANVGRAVIAAGRTIRVIDLRTTRQRLVAFTGGPVVGVTISGRRITWAENVGKRGRIRTLLLSR